MSESNKTRGREVSPNTLAIRALFEQHGDMSYQNALEHIEKMEKGPRTYFTEVVDGKNAGANRYNVAKNGWKKANGGAIKARKTTKTPKAEKPAKVARQSRQVVSNDPMAEVAKMGGLKAVTAEIARLQGLKQAVESLIAKVA